MTWSVKQWRERRTVARWPIAEADWQSALARCGPAARLTAEDRARLRVLATLFLHRKSLEPVPGFELGAADRALLAADACLPILNLGLEWYAGWHSIVIYPDAFVPPRDDVDEAGVVHHARDVLAGEAWLQGPVILAWSDVLAAGHPLGHNVVIHEMAHKLDMLNGDANGYPPMPRGMDSREWARVFAAAWERMQKLEDEGEPLPMDDYALEDPGEFFAVASEMFFEQPAALRARLPALYGQLNRFYRGVPAAE